MISNTMKFCFHILLIFSIPFLSSCAEDDEDLQNETDGYRDWIEYALVNNPDITVFFPLFNLTFLTIGIQLQLN